MSTAKSLRILAGAWLAALLWAPPSAASQEFPQIVADTLAMPCVPTCLLCHNTLQGGIAKFSDFGVEAKGAGVVPLDPATVAPALMTLEMRMPPLNDTDGDGTADIAELRAGADPNVSGVGEICGGDPTYGCGARIARDRMVEPVALGAALGAAFVLVLARRRRRAG